MEKLVFTADDGEEMELLIQAQVRMSGKDYILVSENDDDETEVWIMKDISGPEEVDALFVPVEDEDETAAILPLFEEILEDVDIEE